MTIAIIDIMKIDTVTIDNLAMTIAMIPFSILKNSQFFFFNSQLSLPVGASRAREPAGVA
jgi:hypothetical protein